MPRHALNKFSNKSAKAKCDYKSIGNNKSLYSAADDMLNIKHQCSNCA